MPLRIPKSRTVAWHANVSDGIIFPPPEPFSKVGVKSSE